MSNTLSAVVIAKNEQANIINCLNSLKFCNEIIVIDDFSEDKTAQIARRLGAKVYIRDSNGDFSGQRNFGILKTNSKWILFVDADEIITKKLGQEIARETKKTVNYVSGYFFRRIDNIWGSVIKHGEVGDVRLLRLARRDAGKWQRTVHEYWHIIGETRVLTNPIMHYPHPTIAEFLREINQRSTMHALANKKESKRSSIVKIVFNPIFKFANGYLFKFGFLDGLAGFVIAMVMSLHSFLSWSKLWVMEKNK